MSTIIRHAGKSLLVVFLFAFILAFTGCQSTGQTTTTVTASTSTSVSTPVTVDLVAQNMAFDLKSITVPAGADVTINFTNKDGASHNFSLYTDSSAKPPALFQGEIVNGSKTVIYHFTAPTQPGTYFFRCDIHPTIMTGSFIVK